MQMWTATAPIGMRQRLGVDTPRIVTKSLCASRLRWLSMRIVVVAALLLWPTSALAQATAPAADPPKPPPFAFADFTWLSGNPRTTESPLQTKAFTGEFRTDVSFTNSFNDPSDDTIVGSTEVLRHGEVTLTQLGAGGDFNYNNVQARVMTQFGLYSTATPRNDPSPARGQWQLD